MSLLDALIFGIRRLWVNGVEQPTKSGLELRGDIAITQDGDRNILSITGGSGGGNTTAHYVLTEEDLSLPNSHVIDGSDSIFVDKSLGAVGLYCIFGTTTGTVCEGNDTRLSNARTPTSHAATHKHSGGDEIATATAAANAIPKAGAGGQLDIGWLPTGTTSGKIPVLDSSGQIAATAAPNSRWYKAPGTLSNTAIDDSTLSLTNGAIRKFQPAKVLDLAGTITSGNAPTITVVTSITGLTMGVLDWLGKLYFKSVAVSGSNYRFDIYSDKDCTKLIGHTSSFDASVTTDYALTITADNGSGIGGTVTAHAINESRTAGVHSVCFIKVGYVGIYGSDTGVSADALDFWGPALSTSTGYIRELWLGAHDITSIQGSIPGKYASATTSQVIVDRTGFEMRWPYGAAYVYALRFKNGTNDTGATQAKISPVLNGTQIIADGFAPSLATNWNSSTFSTLIERDQTMELRVIKGTNYDSLNLSYEFVAVLL